MTTTLTETTYRERLLKELDIEKQIDSIATEIRHMRLHYFNNENLLDLMRKIRHTDMRKTIKATDDFMGIISTQIEILIMKRMELEEQLFESEEQTKSNNLSTALLYLLEENNITSDLLAHKLGYHKEDIDSILDGNFVPFGIIDLIASYFNIKKQSWYNL